MPKFSLIVNDHDSGVVIKQSKSLAAHDSECISLNSSPTWTQHFKSYLSSINVFLLIILIFILVLFVSPILSSISYFFISFFGLGFPVAIILRRKDSQFDLLELVMNSVFTSLLMSVSIILVLSAFNLNSMETFSITSLLVFTALFSVVIIKVKGVKVEYGKTQILSLLLFGAAITIFLVVNVYFDKFYTPDEYFYLKNSLDFIRQGYLTPIAYDPVRSFSNILDGRFLWQAMLASFIEATSGQLPYYVINLPFFIILLCSTLGLLRFLLKDNIQDIIIVWLIVSLNPLIFILSHFVLIDFAFASLSLFAVYWFVKSFEGKVDAYCLIKCFTIIVISLLMKFNLLLLVVLWFLFTYSFLRNKFYRLSSLHKALFLIIVTPVIAYELFLDIPALFTYYVLHDLQLNYIFARYVFFSPLGMLVNFLFRTPWTFRTWSDIPGYDKLFYFFNILSPELMTPMVASFALLSFLILRKDHLAKMLADISLLALLLTFIGFLSSGNYYDIQRDALSIILLLEVVGLTSLLISLNGNRHFVYASVVLMQIITSLEYIVLVNKGFNFYSWGGKLENTYDYLFLMNVVLSILVLPVMLGTSTRTLQLKLLKTRLSFKPRFLMFILLFFILLGNNLYFISDGLNNNTYFLSHGMDNLAPYAEASEGKELLISNAYALPLYTKTDNLIFISPPLNADEFGNFLKSNLSAELVLSNDEIATWISQRIGSSEYLHGLPPIITTEERTQNTPVPLFDQNREILFHLSFVNSSDFYTPFGNELNMLVNGAPIWKDENGTKIMYLDGLNDNVVISGAPLSKPSQKLTVEVWFRTEKPQNGKFLVMGGYGNGTYLWGVYLSTNSTQMSFYMRGQKIYNPIISGKFDDGFWHQFVGVFDGKNMTVYFDGKPVKSIMLGETITINPSDDFKIYVGSWAGHGFFEGYIGSVNVYEDVLEPSDVIEQYVKAQSKSGIVLANVVNDTAEYTIYDVYGENVNIPTKSIIDVKNIGIMPLKVGNNFNQTALTIDFYSEKSFNGTLILNTYYFSIFRLLAIKEGYNHFELILPNTLGSLPYGLAIGQKTEILVFNDNGELLVNTVVASTVLKERGLLYVLVPVMLSLLFYVYLDRKRK